MSPALPQTPKYSGIIDSRFLADLSEKVTKLLEPIAWKALPLGVNWENFNVASFAPAMYGIDGLGMVHLRGVIKSIGEADMEAYNNATNLLFQLPEKFRHNTTGQMFLAWGEGTTSSLGVYRLDMFSGGETYVLGRKPLLPKEKVQYLSLSNISPFPAEH